MNKNKLSLKKIQLYVVAVSLCLFCLVYFRVYDEQKKEAEAIENESYQVMEQVTERKILLEEEEKLKEVLKRIWDSREPENYRDACKEANRKLYLEFFPEKR